MADKTEKDWSKHPRVLVSSEKNLPAHGKITKEMEDRRNARSHIPFFPRDVYFNTQASKDAIRHFTAGIGDTNPLFRDEGYAKRTKYGSIVAPGSFLYTVQWVVQGGGMPGVHAWYSGGDWEWYRPIFAGDEFRPLGILRDVEVKEGRMAGGGQIYIDYDEGVYLNHRGEIVGKELHHTVWVDRGSSSSAGKYRKITRPTYTKEDWIKMLETYDKEEIRGSDPRWWEDIQVGDMLGPMIKGPLTVRDEIAWLMGAGSPFFRADKIEYEWEYRHPRALEYVDEMDEADVPELVHIFDAYARAVGVERAYDYGSQRMTWLCMFLTNWMGDDAFLWKMSGDLRAFNQLGDVTTFEGKVVKKYIEDSKCCVDIEAWAKNQREEWSMPPRMSTVILPSRDHGPVVYPELQRELVKEVSKARPLNELIREGIL